MLVDRLYGNVNTTSEENWCPEKMCKEKNMCDKMVPNISHVHQMLKNISIIYGNENATEKACDMKETTHFPEVLC